MRFVMGAKVRVNIGFTKRNFEKDYSLYQI